MMESNRNHNSVPAIHRAIDVLEFIAASDRELSLSELMSNLDIPRQSLIRILNTLCTRGFLDKSTRRGLYRIGLKFLYLGHGLHDKFNLRTVAWQHMKDLSRRTHKTIELSTLDRDQLILLEQIRGREEMSLYSRAGSVFLYFHAVSVGKVYLSLMNKDKRRQALNKIGLPPVTQYTITDIEVLEEQIREIQNLGYAFEDQEMREGVRRVAAPIFNADGKHVGCIGLSATIFSFAREDADKFGRMALEAAQKISAEIGYEGPGPFTK